VSATILEYVGTLLIGFEVTRQVKLLGTAFIVLPLLLLFRLRLLAASILAIVSSHIPNPTKAISRLLGAASVRLREKLTVYGLGTLPSKLHLNLEPPIGRALRIVRFILQTIIVVFLLMPFYLITIVLLLGVALPLALVGYLVVLVDTYSTLIFGKVLDTARTGKSTSQLESKARGLYSEENVFEEMDGIPFVGLVGILLITAGFILHLSTN
jgi:hypothetical protein